MKQCPRCASEFSSKDKVCPRCGLAVKDMASFSGASIEETESVKTAEEVKEEKVNLKAQKRAEKIAKKEEKKRLKKEKKERESVSDTDFSKFAKNNPENQVEYEDSYAGRRKRRKDIEKNPQFHLDENGEFTIDTSDVELVGAETGKIIEEKYQQTYSVKKARGDYREPKIKWWELYKHADRYFARRKIKKEVNKAAIKKPDFIKKSKLLLLNIFLGVFGAHNFYAKNIKKGWTSVVCLILWVGVISLAPYSKFFDSIALSVGGGAGFVCMFIWLADMINIIFNKFKYRIQKEAFIFGMNIETRAKLGEKYIDLDLYKKPWWVRFKVWCQKKKRNYEEWKRERRQANIEKEKRKIAKREEQERIDAEIAAFEEKEAKEQEAKKKDIKDVVDKEMLRDVNSFDGGLTEAKPAQEKTEEKKTKKSKEKTEEKVEGEEVVEPKAKVAPKAKISVKSKTNKTKKK